MKREVDNMKNNKINLKVDENMCANLLFSEDLKEMTNLLFVHASAVDADIRNNINEDNTNAILTLLDYADSHDFSNFQLTGDIDGLPFPYLPTLLLTNSTVRRKFVKDVGADFATVCAIFYLRDTVILKNIYEFIINNKSIGSDTNQFIYYLSCFYDKLADLYNKTVHDFVEKDVNEEIASQMFKPIHIPTTEISDYIEHGDQDLFLSSDDGFFALSSSNNIFKLIPLATKFNNCRNDYQVTLGDSFGPIIGEEVDINNLFPFNIKNEKIIRNIVWSN